ncbi:MAG: glycerol-3-phosphate 1-O-acyltransferase PlsB [Gammaproteobacteria bacterium]|nr:glycerol-3-phosphate 1-O-acyltransferase PlsB [Gammaproteobacteria bacterium]
MAGSSRPRGSIYRVINQQLLHLFRLWLRPTFINHEQTALALAQHAIPTNVRYILDSDSLADRLLLELGCEASRLPEPLTLDPNAPNAYFCLNHREGFWGRRSARGDARSTSLKVDPAIGDELATRLVPVSIYWGHQPDRALSLWKVLLSDQWASTSKFRKILCIALTRRHILVHFGDPLDVDELTNDLPSAALKTKRIHRLLRRHFKSQKQSIIGPDLSHRRTLLDELLAAPAVDAAIMTVAEASERPRHRVAAQAYRYASEIASDQSYRVIRFFSIILTWLWNRLYNGIEVSHLERVRAVSDNAEIVYVPCHRSHIDYLLLSYVLYHNGLALPHIAAGINLNLFLVGPLLRRAGAFFMRRSFKEDLLYKAVFDEYIHLLLSKGYSLEYFVEGGRSRTGGMLTPRPGMINMTLRGYYRDHHRDIQFVPVYFSYERVLEISSYLDERKGHQKKTESLRDLFGVFRYFKLDFGQVSVNFGEPISLEQFLSMRVDSDLEMIEPDKHKAICRELGHHIVQGINAAIPVNPTQILATLFVHAGHLEIPEERLRRQLRFLTTLIEADQISSIFDQSDAQIIDYFLSTSGAERQLRDGEPMITITPGGLIDMRYYSNSVTHLFVLPSLIANRLIQEPMIDPEPFFDQLTVLAPLLDAICFSKLAPSAGRINELLEIFDYKTEGQQVSSARVDSPLASDLIQIAGIIEPALKQIALACALLKVKPDLLDDLATINERIKTLTITTTAFNPEDLILTERLIQMLSQTQPINDRKAQDNANWIKPQAALATLISEAGQNDLQHLALDLIKENIQSAATTR